MTYTLPDLAYDYGALEPHYAGHALELHHQKHHAAYVEELNRVLERLGEARADASTVGLEKSLAFNLSGHVLHSLFWKNLSPQGGDEPRGDLAEAIDAQFGSFGQLKRRLAEATRTVQGSGWGMLAWEPLGRRLVVEQIHDHEGNGASGSVPLLVLDAWEHAYYLQYQNRRTDYVAALWKVIHWRDVEDRFDRCRGLRLP